MTQRIILLLLIFHFTVYFSFALHPTIFQHHLQASSFPTLFLQTSIISQEIHDSTACTEGLIAHDNYIYESTGIWGKSAIFVRSVDSVHPILTSNLPESLYGEGICLYNDTIYQLTYKAKIVFIRNVNTLNVIKIINFPTNYFPPFTNNGVLPVKLNEGWGLTANQNQFFISDGSNRIYILNEHFQPLYFITVFDPKNPKVPLRLNELEYIPESTLYSEPLIYAVLYETDCAVIIHPNNGEIIGYIYIGNLWPDNPNPDINNFNGIAYDYVRHNLYITGKYWPFIYKVSLSKSTSSDPQLLCHSKLTPEFKDLIKFQNSTIQELYSE